jgi:tetratricopeptide (TPR) repeat protein
VISSVVDFFKDDGHDVLKLVNVKTNPTYVLMNRDEVILDQSGSLATVQDLMQFYGRGIRVSLNYDEAKKEIEATKSDESYKKMITLLLNSKNVDLAEEYLEDWMQEKLPLRQPENQEFLAQVAESCVCSDRLAAAFRSQEEQLISSLGAGRYLGIRQAYILKELKRYDLVEPYTVWEVYNEEFGIYADSLFRRFAIEYYQFVEPNKEVLMDEVYDYLYYYPETAWIDQKRMFDLAIKYSEDKADFLLLLDMIEYQLYLGSDHEKLDYKAVIMYKLGNKERAVELMKEVEILKPDYTSMVHQLLVK